MKRTKNEKIDSFWFGFEGVCAQAALMWHFFLSYSPHVYRLNKIMTKGIPVARIGRSVVTFQ